MSTEPVFREKFSGPVMQVLTGLVLVGAIFTTFLLMRKNGHAVAHEEEETEKKEGIAITEKKDSTNIDSTAISDPIADSAFATEDQYNYYLVGNVFLNKNYAEKFLQSIKEKFPEAEIREGVLEGNTCYRVFLKRFENRAEALAHQAETPEYWVMKELK